MKKKSVLSLLLAAALALSLAGCAGQGQPGGKEPVVNSDGTITKEENDVKITETAARSIETELYETADFSLQIPKGWTVTSGGTAMYHSIRVQDPSQPLNQMFVLLKAEGLLHSQEGKDAYAYNVTMGNTWAQMLSQAPVLTTPSTENFFKLFSEYAAFVEQWEPSYAGYTFPRFDGFAVTDRFASASLLSSYALGEETLRASFTENGKEGEGMFAASVVDFGSVDIAAGLPVGYIIPRADGGYYMAYNVMAVTAAKDTFIEWESVLTKCLGTLAYSESFVKATEQAGEEKVAMSKEISRITNERLEIIMAAWEDRNVEQDITSQMQSDETGGYERVYDTQTKCMQSPSAVTSNREAAENRKQGIHDKEGNGMRQVKRLLPYVRRYVQMAVYDVLDAEGAEYRKEESGAVVARLSVYGNVSTFSLSTEIQDVGTGLTVSMREPCPGLSAQGEERAVTAVADKVAQYLENELMINRRCFVPDRHYAV